MSFLAGDHASGRDTTGDEHSQAPADEALLPDDGA
jgi:hypothetical protein